MDPIRLVLVDDHRVFSEALVVRLNVEPDIRVLATASTAAAAQSAIDRHRPDVVLVDLELGPGPNGIDLTEQVLARHPSVRVVVVTCLSDPERALEAVRAGAVAWITKDAPANELLRAIRGAARGESWIPPRLLTGVLRGLLNRTVVEEVHDDRLRRLTERERQILDYMVDGLDRAEIARRLYLSKNTVRTHTQNLLTKLQVHSSLEAVSLGLRARAGSRQRPLASTPAR